MEELSPPLGLGLEIINGSPVYDPAMSRDEGYERQRTINSLVRTVDPKAKTVYQDDGRSVVVWLDEPDMAAAEKMRKWLEFKGVHVNVVSLYYDPLMG